MKRLANVKITNRLTLKTFWFIVFTTAAASSVSLLGGMGIEAVEHELLPIIPLLIALPALNTMVGDYATIIAAHAGDPFERKRTKQQLIRAVSWSVAVNIVGVVILSLLLAWRRDFAFDPGFIGKFTIFCGLAICGTVAFMFAITTALDRLLEKRRLNPDDILIPVVTSVSDVLMLGGIALGAKFIF